MPQPARDPRADVVHILDSFSALRAREEREHGEFRTKRAYDLMQEAMDGGRPYPAYEPGPTHDLRTCPCPSCRRGAESSEVTP